MNFVGSSRCAENPKTVIRLIFDGDVSDEAKTAIGNLVAQAVHDGDLIGSKPFKFNDSNRKERN